MDDVDRQALQTLAVRELGQHRVEGRRDRRQVGERRTRLKPADVGERAAIAHPGQQDAFRVDRPAFANPLDDPRQVRRVGVLALDRPGAADGRGRGQDRAGGSRVGQPAPQERPAVAAAPVQGDYQRAGDRVLVDILGYIERDRAARARRTAQVQHAAVRPPVAARQTLEPRLIVAPATPHEEPADRRQAPRQGIERLQRARQMPQRAKAGGHPVRIGARHLQRREAGHRFIAGRGQTVTDHRQFDGPALKPVAHGRDRRLGRAHRVHQFGEMRRVKMPRHKGQSFQGREQRRRQDQDVLDRPVARGRVRAAHHRLACARAGQPAS